MALDGSERVAP